MKEPEKTKASVVNFGTVAASKVILQPGWKWSEDARSGHGKLRSWTRWNDFKGIHKNCS